MKNKILIVDDQEIIRDILAGILHEDYELVLATNGVEAVAALGRMVMALRWCCWI